MAENTTIASLPYPVMTDTPSMINAVKPLALALDDKIVPRFPTTSARDSAIPTPTDGQVCYVTTHGAMVYKTSWCPLTGPLDMCLLVAQATQSILNTTNTPLEFATSSQIYLPFGGHSTSSNNSRFIPPFPGRYRVRGTYVSDTADTTGYREVAILKNGSFISESRKRRSPTSITFYSLETEATATMNGTTDYFSVNAYQNRGGALLTYASSGIASSMSVQYLGPNF